jgi:hypothetical protein
VEVDVAALEWALEDQNAQWFFDPRTGECWPDPGLAGEGEVQEHWVRVEPLPSSEAWEVRASFARNIEDSKVREAVMQVLSGRGAFSRFRQAVDAHEATRQAWHAFHDREMRERAIAWLNQHRIAWSGSRRLNPLESVPRQAVSDAGLIAPRENR